MMKLHFLKGKFNDLDNNQIIPGTICPVDIYAPTKAITPKSANLPFNFSAVVF